jgi:hypothetical protein
MLPNDKLSTEVQKIISNIDKVYYHPLTTISKEEELAGEDYISLAYKNIELLKKELYD